MTILRRTLLLTAVLLMGGSGCSDDDGGSSSSSTQLRDLSLEELKTQCGALAADFDALERGGCMLSARDETDCDAAAAACPEGSSIDCSAIVASDVADCTVTVGELKSCLSSLAGYFSGITCAEGPTGAPPTCMQSVGEKCPIFQ